jgi:signal transduction histidine kinase
MHTLLAWITIATSYRPFWIGAALSTAAGLLFYMAAYNTIERDASERFANIVRTAHFTILGRFKSYTDVLRGSASVFHMSPEVSRDQFHHYVKGLRVETEFPGIDTVNFARYVTDAERPAFEERMRAELASMPDRTPGFRIYPPARRDEYLILSFIETGDAALRGSVGYDLLSRPSNAGVAAESRDSGRVTVARMPIPTQGDKAVMGIGMRLPVYHFGMPIATVQQRRAAYLGSVGITINVERLMRGVLEALPVRGMRLRLVGEAPAYGPGKPERRMLLFNSTGAKGNPATATSADGEFSIIVPINLNDFNLEAYFRINKATMHTGIDAYAPWLAMLAGLVSTALLYALFHTLSSSRRRAITLASDMTKELRTSESKLKLSRDNLRRLAAHADNIKEDERKRIAREIHDDLGQNLLALRIEADVLEARTRQRLPHLNARARATLQQIDTTIKSVRQIINDLRPNALDLGLAAAVEWQVVEFRRLTGIECELVEDGQEAKASDRCATALFRILQESLSNISRHARSTKVLVHLCTGDQQICMIVSDNGIGIRDSNVRKPGSFGLVGIEERIRILGGTFEVTSEPGKGTTIKVQVPLEKDDNYLEPELATGHGAQDTTEMPNTSRVPGSSGICPPAGTSHVSETRQNSGLCLSTNIHFRAPLTHTMRW